jgi:hypothetical protein
MANTSKSLGVGGTRLAIKCTSIAQLTYGYVLPCAIQAAIERKVRYDKTLSRYSCYTR